MIITIFRSSTGADERHLHLFMQREQINYLNFSDTIYFVSKDAKNLNRILYYLARPLFRLIFNLKVVIACRLHKASQLIIFKGVLIHRFFIYYLRRYVRISIIYPDLDPSVHGESYIKLLKCADRLFYTKPNLREYYNQLFGNKAHLITPLIDWDSARSIGNYDPTIGVLFVGHYSPLKVNP